MPKPEYQYIMHGLGPDWIYNTVANYGNRIGLDLSPHDLRRTLAQLLRKSGAMLEQIQYTLGHEDINTTIMYLGSKLELSPGVAAVDGLMINVGDKTLDRITMALEAERQVIADEESEGVEEPQEPIDPPGWEDGFAPNH